MTPRLIPRLEALARRTEDAAAVTAAGAEVHRAEYERLLRERLPEAAPHDRALELYPLVVLAQRDARQLTREAALLREAIAELTR